MATGWYTSQCLTTLRKVVRHLLAGPTLGAATCLPFDELVCVIVPDGAADSLWFTQHH